MSERFTASVNQNDSKNTRLDIVGEFANYRFNRDCLAHISRYLHVCESWMELAKELGRPIRVLDIGCGDIYIPRTFQASFAVKKSDYIAQYVGVDIDDKSIARTRATIVKSFPIQLVVNDVTTHGLQRWKDNDFDLVTSLEMIEHIKPEFVPPLLREIARVAPRAIISTPNWTGGSGQLPDDHIKEWDTDELAAEMEKAGLRVEKRVGTFCNLPKARKACAGDPFLERVLATLEATCPADFVSLALARFIGPKAQNVIYECKRLAS